MKSFLPFTFLAALAACGGQVAQPIDGGPTSDASTTQDSSTPISDASNPPPPKDASPLACNDVAELASPIVTQLVASDPPPIATPSPLPQPGTYFLESAQIFTGKGGASGPAGNVTVTLRIDSDVTTWHTVSTDETGTNRRNYAITKQALGLALVATCGGSDSVPITFVPISSPGFVMQSGSTPPTRFLFRPFQK